MDRRLNNKLACGPADWRILMKTLLTARLKPNPAGKDKNRWGNASQTQLGAEWADIKNTGSYGVNLDGVRLYHVAFKNGKPSHWDIVVSFGSFVLGAGQVLRVHSG